MNDILRSATFLAYLVTSDGALATQSDYSTSFAVGAFVADTCYLDIRQPSVADVRSACLPVSVMTANQSQPIVTLKRDNNGTIVAINIEF